MDNSVLMNFDELSLPLRAEFLPGNSAGFTSVAIDSRFVRGGSLFFALEGKNHDGHRFVEEAFLCGASGAIVCRSKVEPLGLEALARKYGAALIIVENTLKGLQDSARVYLEKFPSLLRIAVTGSAGKSTTKEIAAAIAGTEKNTVMNTGNLNSETGLPLSVFNVRPEHEVGIFEAGMNRPGEIAELAATLKPHFALITNIGSAHIGSIGSKALIAKEKKNIFSEFTGSETAFIPDWDEYRDFLADGVNGKIVFYGKEALSELGSVKDAGLDGTDIDWAGKICRFRLPGNFNLKNAIAALAIAREIPISAEGVRKGLESVKPLFGRGEILYGKAALIRDCYNSNPESLEAAVEYCDSLDWPGRRVYVIGSMLELGEVSEESHRIIGNVLAASLADKIFLYGRETEICADALSFAKMPFFYTDDMAGMEKALNDFVCPGDLVLLKGSRGCALERLSDLLLSGSKFHEQCEAPVCS